MDFFENLSFPNLLRVRERNQPVLYQTLDQPTPPKIPVTNQNLGMQGSQSWGLVWLDSRKMCRKKHRSPQEVFALICLFDARKKSKDIFLHGGLMVMNPMVQSVKITLNKSKYRNWMSREIRLFNPENSKNTVAVPSSDTDDTPLRTPKWTNNLAALEAFPWWLWLLLTKTTGKNTRSWFGWATLFTKQN